MICIQTKSEIFFFVLACLLAMLVVIQAGQRLLSLLQLVSALSSLLSKRYIPRSERRYFHAQAAKTRSRDLRSSYSAVDLKNNVVYTSSKKIYK